MSRIDPMTGKLDPDVVGVRLPPKEPTTVEKLEALAMKYEVRVNRDIASNGHAAWDVDAGEEYFDRDAGCDLFVARCSGHRATLDEAIDAAYREMVKDG